MPFIGAIDQGTSSTRFIIFDEKGSVVAVDQREHAQILPQAGWVEHDASEIWTRTQEVMAEALRKAGLTASDLAAIGITNQRETTVVWNRKTGQPLANAIVWQDTRTTEFFDRLSESTRKSLIHKTGLALAPYFSGSKIWWFLKNIPGIQQLVDQGEVLVGTIDSWLVWNLSGGLHITDVTNASRTLLMNLETLQWDDELLQVFDVPRSILPEIRSSSEVYGHTLESGVLKARVPIAGILGDQQAAMVGQARFERGGAKTTYGTGNFALLNTGTELVRSQFGLLSTVCYKFGSASAHYALEGSVAVTGSAVQWLRDQMGIINSASEIESLASQVSDNGGVYFVPAFSGLFAPYWRNDARGVIVGLTRAATKAHLARATLEAIGYQTRDIMDAMSSDSGVALSEMRVDGGITMNELCMQIQSDIVQVPVIRPKIIETTALGAAYAAGLAVGLWESTEEVSRQWRSDRVWEPHRDSTLATSGFTSWKRAIERSMDWIQ